MAFVLSFDTLIGSSGFAPLGNIGERRIVAFGYFSTVSVHLTVITAPKNILRHVTSHTDIQDSQHSYQRTTALNTIGPNSPDA